MSGADADRGTAAPGTAFGMFESWWRLVVSTLGAFLVELGRLLLGQREQQPTVEPIIPPTEPIAPMASTSVPPAVIPPVGDTAENWVRGLVPHHGPYERCHFADCVVCWAAPPEMSD